MKIRWYIYPFKIFMLAAKLIILAKELNKKWIMKAASFLISPWFWTFSMNKIPSFFLTFPCFFTTASSAFTCLPKSSQHTLFHSTTCKLLLPIFCCLWTSLRTNHSILISKLRFHLICHLWIIPCRQNHQTKRISPVLLSFRPWTPLCKNRHCLDVIDLCHASCQI